MIATEISGSSVIMYVILMIIIILFISRLTSDSRMNQVADGCIFAILQFLFIIIALANNMYIVMTLTIIWMIMGQGSKAHEEKNEISTCLSPKERRLQIISKKVGFYFEIILVLLIAVTFIFSL